MAYLNTEQAAFYLGCVRRETDANGTVTEIADRVKLRDYLSRHRVPTYHRGRSVLVREIDLDKSLQPGPHARPQPRSIRRTA